MHVALCIRKALLAMIKSSAKVKCLKCSINFSLSLLLTLSFIDFSNETSATVCLTTREAKDR